MRSGRLRVVGIAAVAAIGIASCGIPIIQFLGPVETESIVWSVSPPTVTFAHNVSDNSTENFLGYEVYYKFYALTPDPGAGEFGTDLAAINAAAPGTGNLTVVTQGFRRIWQANDSDGILPLLEVSPGESASSFDVTLIFPDRPSQLSPDPASADFLARNVQLAREPDAGLSGETFESDDISTNPNDSDIPPGIPAEDLAIHMGVVILAYGTDNTGGTFQPLHSEPTMVEQPLELSLQ